MQLWTFGVRQELRVAATIILLPGAGSDSWYWHRVEPELHQAGHNVIAVDLPYDNDAMGQYEFADLVVAAARRAERPLVVVAPSMSAFTAVIVCERHEVDLLVLVAPMLRRGGVAGSLVGGHRSAGRAARPRRP